MINFIIVLLWKVICSFLFRECWVVLVVCVEVYVVVFIFKKLDSLEKKLLVRKVMGIYGFCKLKLYVMIENRIINFRNISFIILYCCFR